jgi:hypothetical protein
VVFGYGRLVHFKCRNLAAHGMVYIGRGSVVVAATGYGLGDWRFGVRVPVESRIFSSPLRPDQLWGTLRLLSRGYSGLFPEG